ncbi:hypothetical protein HNY73_017768 [Argiope bruennichi]|uniref:Uncharacterized protein n=1 Tax=Argiope bruennichi TaxID=94029 RepID=A0A8T0EBX0_ARGBR|nr:hypothetical protein HNY73_017768 [Argiope bruennichi]
MPRKYLSLAEALALFEQLPSDDDSFLSGSDEDTRSNGNADTNFEIKIRHNDVSVIKKERRLSQIDTT